MDGMASNVAVPLVATSVEENKWIKHEILVKEKRQAHTILYRHT